MITDFDIYENPPIDDVLAHYGILGMHWGIRRYQNPDGTLTEAGRKHYRKALDKEEKKKERKEARARKIKEKLELSEKQKRQIILSDPSKLQKNLDMFTNDEIADAYRKFEWQQKLGDLHIKKETKFDKANKAVNKALSYGETANNALKFLNSPVGKELRSRLGYDTDDLGVFKTEEQSSYDRIKQQAEIAKFKKQIIDYQNEVDKRNAKIHLKETSKKKKDDDDD